MDKNTSGSKTNQNAGTAKRAIDRFQDIEDDSNSQSEDKSPITPIHFNHPNNQAFQSDLQDFMQLSNKNGSSVNGGAGTFEGGVTAIAKQIQAKERDAYYGFFKNHESNDGKNIFYNLDEIWEDNQVQDKYKYANSTMLYEYYEIIGEGGFSKVFRAKFLPTGEIMAVKILKISNQYQQILVDLAKSEAQLLSQLDHENIVKVKHLIQLKGKLYMGMEYIEYPQLFQLIQEKSEKNEQFSDIETSRIMRKIVDAVSYIHDKGIIHRDLKVANILVDPSTIDLDNPKIKIIDFGFGNKSQTSYDDHMGTLMYMAPEVALNQEYTKSVDIWALGIIMHMLLTGGRHPFYQKNDSKDKFVKKLQSLKKVEVNSNISWLAENLLQRLLGVQAHQRYTANDILRHPWVTRRQYDQIPQSFLDQMTLLEYEQSLKNKMQAIFFMSLIRQQNDSDWNSGIEPCLQSKQFVDYKNRLKMVSDKINKWHIAIFEQNNNKEFTHDDDFMDMINSPNEFFDGSNDDSCSSNEQYNQKEYFDMPMRELDFVSSMSFDKSKQKYRQNKNKNQSDLESKTWAQNHQPDAIKLLKTSQNSTVFLSNAIMKKKNSTMHQNNNIRVNSNHTSFNREFGNNNNQSGAQNTINSKKFQMKRGLSLSSQVKMKFKDNNNNNGANDYEGNSKQQHQSEPNSPFSPFTPYKANNQTTTLEHRKGGHVPSQSDVHHKSNYAHSKTTKESKMSQNQSTGLQQKNSLKNGQKASFKN